MCPRAPLRRSSTRSKSPRCEPPSVSSRSTSPARLQRALDHVELITGDPEVERQPAVFGHGRRDGIEITDVNLPRGQRQVRRDELVAEGEDTHTRALVDADLGFPERGSRRQCPTL